MKLTATSLTALTLSAIDAGTWWNSRYNNGNAISQPSTNTQEKLAWTYNSPKFYQNTINSFRRPLTNQPSPNKPASNPFYNNLVSKALEDDVQRTVRPSSNTGMQTSKVKVRVTVSQRCNYLPSIVTVQDRINKDYVMRQLVGKKFSAVAVNRFSCNSPTELHADFVFYVYNEDLASFDGMLSALRPSLTRAVGVYNLNSSTQTIRVLPEREIIDEAVTQVSKSISKAIATTGQADASDIVDVAVNNIIEQDSVSVNNIVDDLVNVINVDREEVVNELVTKVENQIRIELTNNLTGADEVDETIRLVSEALSEETKELTNNLPKSPSDPEMFTAVSEIEQQEALNYEDNDVVASIIDVNVDTENETETNETGDIADFLSGFVANEEEDSDMLDSIIEEISIKGEESDLVEENDLKELLLEVTQATPLDQDQDYSAKDLVEAILPSFITDEIENNSQKNEIEENLSEEELLMQAKNEFKNTLLTQPESEDDQADDQANNPIVDEILKISDSSNRGSEEEASVLNQIETDSDYLSEIVSTIVDASQQSAESEDVVLEENKEEEVTEKEQIEQTQTELEASQTIKEDPSQSKTVPNQPQANEVVNTLLQINVDDQKVESESDQAQEEYSADDLYEVINSLVVEESEQSQEEDTIEKEKSEPVRIEQPIVTLNKTETVKVEIPVLNLNSTTTTNSNSTNTILLEESLNNHQNSTTISNQEIDNVINQSEENLLNSNIVEKIVNSMVVEVPEELINSVVSARAKNANSTVVVADQDDSKDGFMNSMVETVFNMFSS
jgi:hypothetical protein